MSTHSVSKQCPKTPTAQENNDNDNYIEDNNTNATENLINFVDITTPYTQAGAISIFWSDPISTYYIKIIERLISNSSKARIQLYKYMIAKEKDKNVKENPVNFLFTLLARIHYDCLMYLSTTPAKNY